ncbi:hypothetical protein EV421DRAFT_1991872 [Armillaria borealis]|uniref:Uncharacterized protein n=1 Tax=Armillaria borealis TaxID=47425 RepID=A0AA39J347_9AGAR|nr:hypothetical protein EV421DRAFT_1991872 [Armillaria borealis]
MFQHLVRTPVRMLRLSSSLACIQEIAVPRSISVSCPTVRNLLKNDKAGGFVEPTCKIVIRSDYVLKACKDVIQKYPGVSWNAASLVGAYDFARLGNSPLQLKHEVFIAFLDEFTAYRLSLALKADQLKSQSDIYVLRSLNFLISTIEDDWKGTIHTILTWTPAAFISHRRFIRVRMSWSTTSSYVSQVLARVS